MVHQHILDHIRQEADKGVTRQHVRETLMARGWSAEEVDAGFELLYPTPKAHPMTQSGPQSAWVSWMIRLMIGATVVWVFYTQYFT